MLVGSFLEHCSIRHAQYGVRVTGLTSLNMSNCVVEYIIERAIEASLSDMQSMHIYNSTIQHISDGGIYITTDTMYKHALSLRVVNSHIGCSVLVESYVADVFFEGCDLTPDDYRFTVYDGISVRSQGGQILVDECRVESLNDQNRGDSLYFSSVIHGYINLNKVRCLLFSSLLRNVKPQVKQQFV